MNDKYKILEKDLGIKKAEDGSEYKIKVKGGDLTCSKEEYKKDGATVKVKVDIIKMDGDKETTNAADKYLDKEVEGTVKRGFLSDSIELPEQITSSIKLKEKLQAPVDG